MSSRSLDRIIIGAVACVGLIGSGIAGVVYFLFYHAPDDSEAGTPSVAAGRLLNASSRSARVIEDGEVAAALEEKEWDRAVALQEAAYAANPGDPRARHALGTVLCAAANGKIEEARTVDEIGLCAEMYRKATAFLGDLPSSATSAWEGYAIAGLAEYGAGDAARGRSRVLDADRAVADNPTISLAKAYILVKEGSYQQAQEPLAIARKGGSEVKEAAEELLKMTSVDVAEQKKFTVAESSRYVVRFEGPERPDVTSTVMSMLEQEEGRVARVVGASPRRRIEVIVYTSNAYAARRGLPDWIGGLFDGRIRLNIGDVVSGREGLRNILAHEFTHASIYDLAGNSVPVWLNEGIAMYVEHGGLSRSEAAAQIGPTPPRLAALNQSFTRLRSDEVGAAYYYSYAVVDWIATKYGQGAIASILAQLKSGSGINQALSKTIGHDVESLDAAVSAALGLS